MLEPGELGSFKEYFQRHKAPPDMVYHPTIYVEVPLVGLVEALACAVLLADVDVVGPSLTNMGIVWQYGPTGEVQCATVVKVDTGCSFSFDAAARTMKGTNTCSCCRVWGQ